MTTLDFITGLLCHAEEQLEIITNTNQLDFGTLGHFGLNYIDTLS